MRHGAHGPDIIVILIFRCHESFDVTVRQRRAAAVPLKEQRAQLRFERLGRR
jgi:hypothetical protein